MANIQTIMLKVSGLYPLKTAITAIPNKGTIFSREFQNVL
jgi:hypothetical protein